MVIEIILNMVTVRVLTSNTCAIRVCKIPFVIKMSHSDIQHEVCKNMFQFDNYNIKEPDLPPPTNFL